MIKTNRVVFGFFCSQSVKESHHFSESEIQFAEISFPNVNNVQRNRNNSDYFWWMALLNIHVNIMSSRNKQKQNDDSTHKHTQKKEIEVKLTRALFVYHSYLADLLHWIDVGTIISLVQLSVTIIPEDIFFIS